MHHKVLDDGIMLHKEDRIYRLFYEGNELWKMKFFSTGSKVKNPLPLLQISGLLKYALHGPSVNQIDPILP